MNRRDFFDPKTLARQAGPLIAALDEPAYSPDVAPSLSDISLLRASCRAMATQFEILLPFGAPGAQEVFNNVFAEIHRLEAQLTIYSGTSEVSRLNHNAPFAAVPVEERLFGLLELAKRLCAETEGAFDIAAGALIREWGFFRGPPHVPSREELARSLEKTGMHHVELIGDRRAVHFRCRGVEINLGSIGKGYALDRAAELLRVQHGMHSALLHGGRSSVYALGTPPGWIAGWPIAIRHPWMPEQQLAIVRLRDQALGTSAATYRHLEFQGRKLGHILDPRSGWPAEGIASASAVAATAAEADALATAFFILGLEKTEQYCDTRPDVGAIILLKDPSAKAIAIGACLEENSVCES